MSGMGKMVQKSIEAYIVYLRDVKKTSQNTKMSYQRDLNKMCNFFEENGIEGVMFIDCSRKNHIWTVTMQVIMLY